MIELSIIHSIINVSLIKSYFSGVLLLTFQSNESDCNTIMSRLID